MQPSHLASRRTDHTNRCVTFGHLTHARFLKVVSEVQPAVLLTNKKRDDSGCNSAINDISVLHVMLPRCHLADGDAEGFETKPSYVGARALQKSTMSLLSEVWKAVSPQSCHKQESFSKSSLLSHRRPKCTQDHKRPVYSLLRGLIYLRHLL